MSGTIIDYINEYGDDSFCDRPFCDVDSLALCQLSYLKFDGMVADVRAYGSWVTLQEVMERPDSDRLFVEDWYEKSNRALVNAMLSGKRFRTLRMNCYVNLVEKEWETQFSAITFMLEDGTVYIAFRGTDETIIGWKEDFNMAFAHPVPGQSYSVKYLNMVTGRLHGPVYVGGHSKGGNFAVYSAMKCVPKTAKNIVKVYSMDGPGFRPEILEAGEYEKVQEKVVKLVPHASLIGMIFEQDTHYEVVESKSYGIAQHNPYTWLVENREFVKAKDVYAGRRRRNRMLNEWILSLNETQLKIFVDTLYQAVSAAEAESLPEFAANLKESINRVLAALREVDDQTARILREMAKSLFEMAGANMRKELKVHRLRKMKRGRDFESGTQRASEEEHPTE